MCIPELFQSAGPVIVPDDNIEQSVSTVPHSYVGYCHYFNDLRLGDHKIMCVLEGGASFRQERCGAACAWPDGAWIISELEPLWSNQFPREVMLGNSGPLVDHGCLKDLTDSCAKAGTDNLSNVHTSF